MFEVIFPYIFVLGIGLILFSVIYESFFLPYSVRAYQIYVKECSSTMWRDAYHSSDDDVRKELFDLSNALADFADRMRDDLFEISIIDDYQKKLSKVVPKTIKAYDKLSPEKQTLVAGRLFLFLISIRYVLIRHPLLVWTLAFHLKMMITAFVLWRSYNEHVKNFFDFSSYPSLRLATR